MPVQRKRFPTGGSHSSTHPTWRRISVTAGEGRLKPDEGSPGSPLLPVGKTEDSDCALPHLSSPGCEHPPVPPSCPSSHCMPAQDRDRILGDAGLTVPEVPVGQGWVSGNGSKQGQAKGVRCFGRTPWPAPSLSLSLTLCFRASGAVHFTGSNVASAPLGLTRAKPKSLTLATFSSEMRMLRAAKSRCTNFLDSR